MDIISVSELRIETLIGIYEWEQKTPQTIQLDLEIGLPGDHAVASDNIADTIDYSKLVSRVESLLTEQHFSLLEAAGAAVATLIMSDFKAPWVKVSIAKLAPRRSVRRIGVVIERGTRG